MQIKLYLSSFRNSVASVTIYRYYTDILYSFSYRHTPHASWQYISFNWFLFDACWIPHRFIRDTCLVFVGNSVCFSNVDTLQWHRRRSPLHVHIWKCALCYSSIRLYSNKNWFGLWLFYECVMRQYTADKMWVTLHATHVYGDCTQWTRLQ